LKVQKNAHHSYGRERELAYFNFNTEESDNKESFNQQVTPSKVQNQHASHNLDNMGNSER